MTYVELFNLCSDSTLRNRTAVACVIAANTIRTELGTVPNHVNRLLWAKQTLTDPLPMGIKVLPAVLAQNVGLSVAQAMSATDADLQTAVAAAVDLFATGS